MFVATRSEALARLDAFVPRAGRAYAATRNEDRGPDDRSNVSTLAPYVRARLITEEEIVRAVLARHRLSAADKFVQEVFWRTYWKGWLEARPSVWHAYRRDLDVAYERVAREPDLARAFDDAVAGRTGNAAFDAWTHELVTTNYLHNHARMWYASIWTFTLRLPWELGADTFMRHLACGDPASNTLSWRWVAGLHTRGKTYLAKRDNIRHYTAGRLDPGTALATSARALDGPSYAPEALPDLSRPPTREPALLVLHDDDAGIDTLPLDGLDIRASIGLCAADGRSPRSLAAGARDFARGAIADGLSRSPHGDPADVLAGHDAATLAATLVARAERVGAVAIAVPYAPVGPVRDTVAAIEPHLTRAGLHVSPIVRRFDATAWPHATRGFFNLKAKIPAILATLGVTETAD